MASMASSPNTDQLERLRRQYFALYPLHQLRLPSPETLATNQEYLKTRLLNDSLLHKYQPDVGYRKTCWRRIVAALEEGVGSAADVDNELEVDETFYELMADLMVSTQLEAGPSTPGSSYRTFIYDTPAWVSGTLDERSITLVEELAAIQAGTTGLRTWTAALHLAHHILRNPAILVPDATGSRLPPILELGAGTGFLSILLAHLGADVVATDLGEDEAFDTQDVVRRTPLLRLRENVNLNKLERPPQVVGLDWTEAEDERRPDIWSTLIEERRTILAADIIYDPDLVPSIVSTLNVLLRPAPDSAAIIAATVRNESTLRLFLDNCEQRGLEVEVLELGPVHEENPTFWDSALEGRSEVRVYRIHPTR